MSCPGASFCGKVLVTGTVNCTTVKSTIEGVAERYLYAFRICIENCSEEALCNANLKLALDWKKRSAVQSGEIFQSVTFPGVTEILAARLNRFMGNTAWNGASDTNLSSSLFTIPIGKSVVEVFAEDEKMVLGDEVACYTPALFPSLVSLSFSSAKGTTCRNTIETFIGCSPTTISVDPIPRPGDISDDED